MAIQRADVGWGGGASSPAVLGFARLRACLLYRQHSVADHTTLRM